MTDNTSKDSPQRIEDGPDLPSYDAPPPRPEESNIARHAWDELNRAGAFTADTDFYGGMTGRAVMDLVAVFVEQPGILGTHSRDACQGSGCVVHHPSDHAMRDWPLQPRPDRRMVERTCPHGVGHPDPDDAAYRASRGDTDSVHGCDGCCRTGGVVS